MKMTLADDIAKIVPRPERLDVLIERPMPEHKLVYWKRKTRACILL